MSPLYMNSMSIAHRLLCMKAKNGFHSIFPSVLIFHNVSLWILIFFFCCAACLVCQRSKMDFELNGKTVVICLTENCVWVEHIVSKEKCKKREWERTRIWHYDTYQRHYRLSQNIRSTTIETLRHAHIMKNHTQLWGKREKGRMQKSKKKNEIEEKLEISHNHFDFHVGILRVSNVYIYV